MGATLHRSCVDGIAREVSQGPVGRPRGEFSFESEMKFVRALPIGVVHRLNLGRRR